LGSIGLAWIFNPELSGALVAPCEKPHAGASRRHCTEERRQVVLTVASINVDPGKYAIPTAYRDGVGLVNYRIAGSVATLKDFELSDPTPVKNGAKPGTEVIIENLHKEFGSLTHSDAPMDVTREFAS
jgi:hypothetical protein